MTDPIYHEWNGLKFGHDGTAEAYPLVEANGLDDLSADAADMAGSGDGAGVGSLYLNAASWVEVVELRADDEATMITRRDALKAATVPATDRRELAEFTIHHGADTVRTVFARVTRRTIPTDRQSLVDLFAECQIAFEAPDPTLYGPTDEAVLDPGDTVTVVNDGPVVSGRWTAEIVGPVTNPKLVTSLGHVVRYVGTVGSGHTLLLDLWPRGGTWTLDGDNCYGHLDGGTSSRPPRWLLFAPGSQTVTYTAASGSGTCTLTTRSAYT